MNVCVEKLYASLVYTEQVNNAFRALWLIYLGVISNYYSSASSRRVRF